MGYGPMEVATITALARHHLLLPDTATRRDLDDPMTVTTVADAVGGSSELLDLLHALTIADAAATGPLAWSDWKAGLITDLVQPHAGGAAWATSCRSCRRWTSERRALAEARELAVVIRGDEVVVAAPDRVGVLYRTAGVLALHSLDVRAASIRTHAGMAVNSFVVEPRFGRLPDPAVVRTDLAHALDGKLSLADRLRDKEKAYAPHRTVERLPPTVLWFDEAATDATVVEFRGDDSIGLLCRVTAALERCGLDVRSARVSSLGGSVVDAFYVTTRDGKLVPPRPPGQRSSRSCAPSDHCGRVAARIAFRPPGNLPVICRGSLTGRCRPGSGTSPPSRARFRLSEPNVRRTREQDAVRTPVLGAAAGPGPLRPGLRVRRVRRRLRGRPARPGRATGSSRRP